MKHDFADQAYQEALLDLFKPGSGTEPPLLAGREQPSGEMESLLRSVSKGEPALKDAILYGPRGNGKTVLLLDFERTCLAQGATLVKLDASDIDTLPDLAECLLNPPVPGSGPDVAADTTPERASRQIRKGQEAIQAVVKEQGFEVSKATTGVPAIASLEWEKLPPERLKNKLKVILLAKCRKAPMLVTVDEAHTLDVAVGRRLLNISQFLRGQGAPFLLALAGTPGLREHLGKMDATFWGRSKKLPIGRLSGKAARESLAAPLQAKGVTFEQDALAAVIEDSQSYPYFLQEWGQSLCRALVKKASTHTITMNVVQAAKETVDYERRDYYQDRYVELRKQRLLTAADLVAGLFAGQVTCHYDALVARLAHETNVGEDVVLGQLEQLTDLGYIWEPGGGAPCEPGIPSLMSYVHEKLQNYDGEGDGSRGTTTDGPPRP